MNTAPKSLGGHVLKNCDDIAVLGGRRLQLVAELNRVDQVLSELRSENERLEYRIEAERSGGKIVDFATWKNALYVKRRNDVRRRRNTPLLAA